MQVLKWKCAAVWLADIELSFHWVTSGWRMDARAQFRPLLTRFVVRRSRFGVRGQGFEVLNCQQRQTRNSFKSLWTLVSRLSGVVRVNQRRDHLKGDLMRSLLSFLMGKANICSAKNKLSRGIA